jgi:Yip1 domain
MSPPRTESNFFPVSLISFPHRYLDKMGRQPVKADILSFIAIVLAGSFLFLIFYGIQKVFFERAGVPNLTSITVMIATTVFLLLVDGLFFLLVISLIGHFFVLFTGGKPDFEKTLKSVITALALPILFIWLPIAFHVPYSLLVLAAVFMVFTCYGIRKFHQKTKDQAAFVAIFTTGTIVVLLYIARVNMSG